MYIYKETDIGKDGLFYLGVFCRNSKCSKFTGQIISWKGWQYLRYKTYPRTLKWGRFNDTNAQKECDKEIITWVSWFIWIQAQKFILPISKVTMKIGAHVQIYFVQDVYWISLNFVFALRSFTFMWTRLSML